MADSNYKALLYRQQFLIGPGSAPYLEGWQKHWIDDALCISAHPDLNITAVSDEDNSLTLLGYLLDPARPEQNNADILSRLLNENSTVMDIIRSTYDLCGNWVLLLKHDKQRLLFHDSAGARCVYYTDIDRTNDLWIAAQPRIVAPLLNLAEDPEAVNFIETYKSKSVDYWWPGDKSPYTQIKALFPNHYLDLKIGKAIRYWPEGELVKLPEEEAIERISTRLKGIMAAAANRFDMALALSCGLDSRVMLAASRDIIHNVCAYNSRRPWISNNHPDIRIPKRLAKKYGFELHSIVQSGQIDQDFKSAYALNAPHAFTQILPGLQAELKYFNRQKVGVTGNILEVVRFHYRIYDPDAHPPSGAYLAELTKLKDIPFAVDAFDGWLNTFKETFNYNIYELFHWEVRTGRWLANNCLVYSMAWNDVFFPYNCRRLLVDFLAAPAAGRMPDEYLFFKKLIRHMWPELLSEPINPQKKPKLIGKVKNKLRQIMHVSRSY
jgi:hypothetical protein